MVAVARSESGQVNHPPCALCHRNSSGGRCFSSPAIKSDEAEATRLIQDRKPRIIECPSVKFPKSKANPVSCILHRERAEVEDPEAGKTEPRNDRNPSNLERSPAANAKPSDPIIPTLFFCSHFIFHSSITRRNHCIGTNRKTKPSRNRISSTVDRWAPTSPRPCSARRRDASRSSGASTRRPPRATRAAC